MENDDEIRIKPIDLKVCPRCRKYFSHNIWKPYIKLDSIIKQLIKKQIDAKNIKVKFPEHKPNPGVRAEAKISFNVDENEFLIPAKVSYTLCPKCSKAGTQYYEATDALGRVKLKLPKGTYTVMVSGEGYKVISRTIDVKTGTNLLNVAMDKKAILDIKFDELYESMNITDDTVRAKEVAEAYTNRMDNHIVEVEAIKEDENLTNVSPVYEAAEKIRELEEENKKLKEKIESLKMQIKYCADDNKILHEALDEILDFHDNSNAVAKIANEAIETVFRD